MKALKFIVVFLLVAATVTVAALTAMFSFWSFLAVQPGTATALAMLFLVAPGLGIASGIAMAVRAVGQPRRATPGAGLPLAAVAAVTGGLAGYGACLAAIDLTYTERWSDPGSAPAWLPLAPPLAGLVLAVLLALLVLRPGIGAAAGRRPD